MIVNVNSIGLRLYMSSHRTTAPVLQGDGALLHRSSASCNVAVRLPPSPELQIPFRACRPSPGSGLGDGFLVANFVFSAGLKTDLRR